MNGAEYLVEVRNTALANVPKDWLKISSTKVVSRFHSPELVAMVDLLVCIVTDVKVDRLNVAREHLKLAAQAAWLQFLSEFGLKYDEMRFGKPQIISKSL